MPPQSAAQKAAVANFMNITGAPERVATRYLKSSGYKANEAVDAYLNSGAGGANNQRDAQLNTQLNKVFDSFRDEAEDAKDCLNAGSTQKYLEAIGASIEDASFFAAMELFQAPAIGEVPRNGFVKGWKDAGVDGRVEAQKTHFKGLLRKMPSDRDLFKKVYRYAFVVGKESDQRAIPLETAMTYWDLLFKSPGMSWVGSQAGIQWLTEYTNFLNENWSRSVNRDMWNQTLEFAYKSMDDETLAFWSEDGAWPGVIDDFVAWWRKKTAMDVDE
ncbi:Cullin binding-domain-containing protein [Xylariaceae sp. FL0804]|nr:Cullin binding-domain-containing protein [Xylariaceae sp. FL0804]